MYLITIIFKVLCVMVCIVFVYCAPMSETGMMNYLTNYGYTNSIAVENLTESDKIEATKNFQNIAQIPVTGIMDNETQRAMQKPRCMMPNILNNTFIGEKWLSKHLTYKFANKPSLTFDFTNASIALEVAMRHWTNYADVTTELVQEGKADIEINFVDPRNKTPAEEYALAYALAPRNGDLFFFEEDWSDYEVDFMQIAAHEFGHSLGLGHDKDSNSVMYEFFEYKNNFSLHSNDKYRITNLYGTRYIPCKHGKFDAIIQVSPLYYYIIRGSQCWEYKDNKLTPGFPYLLSKVFPGLVHSEINSAFVYEYFYYFLIEKDIYVYNGTTTKLSATLEEEFDASVIIDERLYTFKDSRYWRYSMSNAGLPILIKGYPRPIQSLWKGVPDNINSAYYDSFRKEIHFFKDGQVYIFKVNDRKTNPVAEQVTEMEFCKNSIDTIVD